MKFECEKTLLASAIDGVSRAITNRAAIPVLEGIYMKAEGFNLTLTGYDMEMGITTTIECNVLVPGETVLDAKLLSAMVNRMPAGDVCIELNDEGQARISGGVAEFEIPALNASDYPSLPVTGADNTMTVKCGMLREMIEKTIYAVSQDDKKPAHTGELFVIEPGSLTIVALDGYRLAIIQRDVECTRDIRIIIPAKTLQELLKIMGGADDDVKIDANRRYVVFTSNGYTIMSRLIEGDFLNYESVIPKDKKGQSFPSRHVYSAFIIAFTFMNVSAVNHIFLYVGIVLALIAMLVAVIRVISGVHFISDVFAAFAFAAFIQLISYYL